MVEIFLLFHCIMMNACALSSCLFLIAPSISHSARSGRWWKVLSSSSFISFSSMFVFMYCFQEKKENSLKMLLVKAFNTFLMILLLSHSKEISRKMRRRNLIMKLEMSWEIGKIIKSDNISHYIESFLLSHCFKEIKLIPWSCRKACSIPFVNLKIDHINGFAYHTTISCIERIFLLHWRISMVTNFVTVTVQCTNLSMDWKPKYLISKFT